LCFVDRDARVKQVDLRLQDTRMQASSKTDFDHFLKLHGRDENTLYQLISTEEGLILWIAEGFSWEAEFDLAQDSESNRILSDYFARKSET